MAFFTTTKTGKLDVIITLFNKDNTIIVNRSSTYDMKPTFKELKELYKPFKEDGACTMRVTTTPSCNSKTVKL